MTVELALLFPLLFLLLMLILSTLFSLSFRGISEVLCGRIVTDQLRQSEPQKTEKEWTEEGNLLFQKSGIGACVTELSISRRDFFLTQEIEIRLQAEHRLWGKRFRTVRRKAFYIDPAVLRSDLELIWDIGEEIPATGRWIRSYEEKIQKLRERISS